MYFNSGLCKQGNNSPTYTDNDGCYGIVNWGLKLCPPALKPPYTYKQNKAEFEVEALDWIG